MPSKDGKFFLNDQLMRAHGKMEKPVQADDPADEQHDPAVPSHKIEVHKHDDASFHTITHHDDGSRSREDHSDLESVKDHLDAHMSDQGAEDSQDDALGKITSKSSY